MSPIFIRPVREQLEHDRLIRFLLGKYKRKFPEAGANAGDEQAIPVRIGTGTYLPDLVLVAEKKLGGLVEIETTESVNNLEAMAQWVPFSRTRVPFHLYVPVNGVDAARRLCEANHARVSEIWSYRPAADGFDLVRVFNDPAAVTAKQPGGKLPAVILPKPAPPKPPPPPEPEPVRVPAPAIKGAAAKMAANGKAVPPVAAKGVAPPAKGTAGSKAPAAPVVMPKGSGVVSPAVKPVAAKAPAPKPVAAKAVAPAKPAVPVKPAAPKAAPKATQGKPVPRAAAPAKPAQAKGGSAKAAKPAKATKKKTARPARKR